MKTRPCPVDLEALYQHACTRATDINEHLPLLRELASDCEHVTEFGLRNANGSTVALLAGQPSTFITWDINPHAVVQENVAMLIAANYVGGGRTKFQPRVGDTLEIPIIEQTDMLFIDTLHTFTQLSKELTRHCDPAHSRVRKYLAFHDTVTFGMKGEDGSEPGLLRAISLFQKQYAFPLWRLMDPVDLQAAGGDAARVRGQRLNNNGLIVLENINVS